MSNAASRDAPPGSYVANHAAGTLAATRSTRRRMSPVSALSAWKGATMRDAEIRCAIHTRSGVQMHGHGPPIERSIGVISRLPSCLTLVGIDADAGLHS